MAYAVQEQSQQEVLNLIFKAVEMSGNKNVVLSGGYALNCVANYWYLDKLNKEGINLYVEPVSSDAGTAIGAALLVYHQLQKIKLYAIMLKQFMKDLHIVIVIKKLKTQQTNTVQLLLTQIIKKL